MDQNNRMKMNRDSINNLKKIMTNLYLRNHPKKKIFQKKICSRLQKLKESQCPHRNLNLLGIIISMNNNKILRKKI